MAVTLATAGLWEKGEDPSVCSLNVTHPVRGPGLLYFITGAVVDHLEFPGVICSPQAPFSQRVSPGSISWNCPHMQPLPTWRLGREGLPAPETCSTGSAIPWTPGPGLSDQPRFFLDGRPLVLWMAFPFSTLQSKKYLCEGWEDYGNGLTASQLYIPRGSGKTVAFVVTKNGLTDYPPRQDTYLSHLGALKYFFPDPRHLESPLHSKEAASSHRAVYSDWKVVQVLLSRSPRYLNIKKQRSDSVEQYHILHSD